MSIHSATVIAKLATVGMYELTTDVETSTTMPYTPASKGQGGKREMRCSSHW